MPRRANLVAAGAIMLATLGLYAWGAVKHGTFDPDRRAERAFVAQYLADHRPDPDAEQALAEAYWRRYPDIARNPAFGRDGDLGVHGPRAHYDRYGKGEGRLWGLE